MMNPRADTVPFHIALSFVAVMILVTVLPAVAQEPWTPPEPGSDAKDWVMMKSGEWLRGSIDGLRDERMEFDSDELDDQVLDWRDIKAFRSPRVLIYAFTNDRVARGTATMDESGVIRVSSGGTVQEFSRGELLSIIENAQNELGYWSTVASIGLTVRAGNTEQQDLNTLLRIKREGARSRIDGTWTNNYGKVSDTKTIENRRATTDVSFFISRRFFVTPFASEYYADRFQNISYRWTVGAGAGIYIFRRGDLEWRAVLGGSYRTTKYLSVEAGVGDTDDTGAIAPGTFFDMDVTDDLEVSFEYSAQVGVPDPKETTHHAEFLGSLDLIGDIFELTLSVIYDRVENPKADSAGIVPKRDDLRLVFGFGVDL